MITVLHNLSEAIVCYAKAVLYLSFVRQAVIGFSLVVVCSTFSFVKSLISTVIGYMDASAPNLFPVIRYTFYSCGLLS